MYLFGGYFDPQIAALEDEIEVVNASKVNVWCTDDIRVWVPRAAVKVNLKSLFEIRFDCRCEDAATLLVDLLARAKKCRRWKCGVVETDLETNGIRACAATFLNEVDGLFLALESHFVDRVAKLRRECEEWALLLSLRCKLRREAV